MSVLPPDAADPQFARRLDNVDALSRAALAPALTATPTSPIAGRSTGDKAAQRRAQLAAQDAAARRAVKALNPADTAVFTDAVALAGTLLVAWHDGAVRGAAGFRSKLVDDQGTILPALVGNLLWAATAIPKLEEKVLLSFFGATLGTIGSIPSSYDQVIGPVVGDYVQRLDELRDDLNDRLDVLVYRAIGTTFAQFSGQDRPTRLQTLWSTMFAVPPSSGTVTDQAATYIRSNLQKADDLAAAKLALYEDAWNASLRVDFVDLEGQRFQLDQARWNDSVRDPVWLWAGRDVTGEIFRGPGDPATASARRQRPAVVLRLAIEETWPSF